MPCWHRRIARAGDLVDIGQANAASWRSAVSDTGSDEPPPVSPPPEGIFASEQMSAALSASEANTQMTGGRT